MLKMGHEITYPFKNFKLQVWEYVSNLIPHFTRHVIIRYAGIKVSKMNKTKTLLKQ